MQITIEVSDERFTRWVLNKRNTKRAQGYPSNITEAEISYFVGREVDELINTWFYEDEQRLIKDAIKTHEVKHHKKKWSEY